MSDMLENQFVQFKKAGKNGEIESESCDIALPFAFGREGTSAFFTNGTILYEVIVGIVNVDGTTKSQKSIFVSTSSLRYIQLQLSSYWTDEEVAEMLDDGELFRFYLYDMDFDYYSNVFRYTRSIDGLSTIKYKCNEDTLGFPFASYGGYASALLPILIKAPQYSQDDKTYVKQDGSVVTLYSQARKEWDGETEYLTESIHDKIMVALMCDELYVDGVRVSKSGSYDVDWDNYDTIDDTKVAKASFKVQSNMVSRNSNY